MQEKNRKIGRNELCPCGSGKKYKHCCYPDKTRAWKTAGLHDNPAFSVVPVEKPEPITNHGVFSNGTWKTKPGTLAVRISTINPKNVDETISSMLKSIRAKIDTIELSDNAKQELRECIVEIEHKLYAVKYHLNNYEQAESEKVKEFSKNYKPPTGVQMETKEPRLIYEIEAFLFQTKSCLDILSWVLKPTFGFTHCDFGSEGDDIIKLLKNNCPTPLATHARKIIELIENAQNSWIVELIKMRDEITHYSRLKGFDYFIQDPYKGGDNTYIHYPAMPNKRRALEYCQEVWKNLLSFCENFINLSIEATACKS